MEETYLCYSYAMGVSKDIYKLKGYGFIIKEDDGDYMVSFSENKSYLWEEFICRELKSGFWNEYIGDNKIVFIFKFENGEIKKYIFDDSNNTEILNLCCEFANTKFGSIKEMILGNKFYKETVKYFYR